MAFTLAFSDISLPGDTTGAIISSLMATGQGLIIGQRTVADRLIEAAKYGQVETVGDLLRKHPGMVDSVSDGGTALMWAIYYERTDVVQLLLEAGASINKKNDRGKSALHWAASNKSHDEIKEKQIVEMLLQRRADINSVDEDGNTPLFHAIQENNTEVVKLLINHTEIDLSIKNNQGQNLFHCACQCGYVDVVKMLLQRRAEINSVDEDGNTPLFHAIKKNNTEVVDLLINHLVIDLSIKNNKGRNLLHCASEFEEVDVWKTLLERGAEINSVDGDGNTPLFKAIRKGNTEVVKLLINHPEIDLSIKNNDGENLLHCASDWGNVDVVKTLLERGAEINSVDEEGYTALFYAIWKWNTEVVELLINHPEIDLSIKNNKGQNLLHFDCWNTWRWKDDDERKAKQIVQKLLQAGLDVNSVDEDGNTPLFDVLEKEITEVAKLLINHPEIDLGIKNNKGQNLLHCASRFSDPIKAKQIVEMLSRRGVDINSVDGNGDTPLFYAIRNRNTEVVELLINHPEIDLSIKNNQGKNVLHCANEVGNVDILKTLLQRGAEINSVDEKGNTPLFDAIRDGDTEVVELLINHPQIDLNIKNNDGKNLLYYAGFCGKVDFFKTLLQKGAKITSVDGDVNKLLFDAIWRGNTKLVELLINHPDIDLSIKNEQGQNLLHCATHRTCFWETIHETPNFKQLVEKLLEAGLDINSVDGDGNTPLLYAITVWNTEVIELLINHPEIDLSIKNKKGENLLHRASQRYWCFHHKTVDKLLQAGLDVNSVDGDGNTPLFCAIRKQNTEVIELLINHPEIDLSIKNKQGQNLLHCASEHKEWKPEDVKQIVEKLLQKGLDVNSVDGDGNTPLFCAIRKRNTEVIELLINHPEIDLSIKNKQGQNLLHCASEQIKWSLEDAVKQIDPNVKQILEKLLQAGLDVNSVDGNGNTPLFYAIWTGNTEVVKLLINHQEIDLSIKNNQGQNLFHCACQYYWWEPEDDPIVKQIMEKLLQAGLDINSVDVDGDTPLFYAIRTGSTEVIELLINHPEIDLSIKNKKGQNFFHFFSKRDSSYDETEVKQCVEMLLQTGLDVNSVDNDGNTSLHLAIKEGNKDAIKLLINHPKIDFSIKNKEGFNALHLAVLEIEINRKEVVQKMLEKGTDINSVDGNGCTALDHAKQNEDTEVIEQLIHYQEIDASLKKKKGFNDLHHAVIQNDVVTTKRILVNHPYLKDSKIQDIFTALHIAALNGHDQVVGLLIQKGARLDIRDNKQQTALHMAAKESHFSTVKLLITKGADVNSQDENGQTCLHLAIMNHSAVIMSDDDSVVNLDMDISNAMRKTVYDEAKQVMELLINHPKTDFSLKNKAGFNVLHLAALRGNAVATKIILTKHTEIIDTQDKDSFTALHLAALNGHEEMTSLLIEKGAKLDVRSRNQHTPLHMATMKFYLPIIELLLNHGADVNAEDDNGLTCLHIAIMKHAAPSLAASLPALSSRLDKFGNKDEKTEFFIFSLLVKKGADVTIKNKDGFTAYDMITDPVKREAFKMLVSVFG